MRWSWRLLAVLVAAVIAVAAVVPAAMAHPGISCKAVVKIDATGRVRITVNHDALAFALDETPFRVGDGPMNELLNASDQVMSEALSAAKDRFATLFELKADVGAGPRPVRFEIVEFPDVAAVVQWKMEHPVAATRLPVQLIIVATAVLPPGTRAVTVRFPEVMDKVILTIDRSGAEPFTMPVGAGEVTPRIVTGENPASTLEVAWRYIVLGFGHIIPEGTDHALFVIGLFLLSPRAKALVWQITAFTIAHSLTLTLATLHILRIPAAVVEPTIALTIAFVAVENLFTKKVHAWRPAVAFVFGLVHGLGFASDLMQVGLPTGQLAAALVSFNVGVECGHLVVLGAAFLLLGWWREKSWYRSRVAIPISVGIAAIALYWMVTRIFAGA